MTLNQAPVRLCCFQRHYGVVCPDGKVMCCLCFNRFDQEDLSTLDDGSKVDICIDCAEYERQVVDRLRG